MVTDNTAPVWSQLRRVLGSANRDFIAQTKNFSALQIETLLDICQKNASSAPGQRCHFASVKDVAQFRANCPVQNYDAIAHEILREAHVGRTSLFSEELVAFEQTGGSSSGGRLIPYNHSLMNDFRSAVFAWFADVIDAYDIESGTIFWPLSPPAPARINEFNGIPVGLGSDAAYFGQEVASLLVNILAVPPDMEHALTTIREWQIHTAKGLLAAENLALISVWSPTFFTELLKFIKLERDLLLELSKPEVSPARYLCLQKALATCEPDWCSIWPGLKLISCWTDGAAQVFSSSLAQSFPGIPIQGKGLLATEAVMSIPLQMAADPVLVPTACFYEFRAEDGKLVTAQDVQAGRTYDLIITTRGGLYRYDIGDRVLVTGFYHEAPMIKFLGRSQASDLCGEKLSDYFVSQCLSALPGYAFLVAYGASAGLAHNPGYELIADNNWSHAVCADEVVGSVEEALAANPQYRLARSLDQLAPLRIRFIKDPLKKYLDAQLAAGRRLGDIKPPVLLSQDASRVFS